MISLPRKGRAIRLYNNYSCIYMKRGWDFSLPGSVKININAFTLNEPLFHGNDSSRGIVVRDDEGAISRL